jgi:protein O-mannosyl-transferase
MGRNSRKSRCEDGRVPDKQAPIAAARVRPFPYASALVSIVLVAAVFAVFGQTLHHGFLNYDDPSYVFENPGLARGTTVERVAWAFTTGHAGNWHPLTWISHLIDYALYGLQEPGGHHLTNVLLHAASALVLFLALRRMTADFWPSALAAAVFAVHPLRVESVAWVAERKDVLSGLLFMLTLWAYAGYATRARSAARYSAVVALFALGLLAKPSIVTLPFVLLLLDYWPLGRFQQRNQSGGLPGRSLAGVILEKVPLAILAAGSCVATWIAQSHTIEVCCVVALPWRIANAVVAYVDYLIQFIWPTNLAVMYPHPGATLAPWKIAVAAAVLTAISAGVVLWRRRAPYLAVGWLWFLGMLVPMIGLVQVGWQARADRYTYLSQIGLCIMLAWTVHRAAAAWRVQREAFVASLAAVAVLAGVAWRQTALWGDDVAFWQHTLDCTEKNYIAHYHLGMALTERPDHDYAKAVEQLEKAKAIEPNDAKIYNALGLALGRLGRSDEAIAAYQCALKIDPRLAPAELNLGAALKKAGRIDDAIAHFRNALAIDRHSAMAHNNLGAAMEAQGDLVGAILCYAKALAIRPNYPEARGNLAVAMQLLANTPAALVRWREWIAIWPQDYVLLNEAAWVMATSNDPALRNGKDALELAQRAAQLTSYGEPTILGTLAAAYAEVGQPTNAARTARRAVEIALQQGQRDLAKIIEARLPLYEKKATGKPSTP